MEVLDFARPCSVILMLVNCNYKTKGRLVILVIKVKKEKK